MTKVLSLIVLGPSQSSDPRPRCIPMVGRLTKRPRRKGGVIYLPPKKFFTTGDLHDMMQRIADEEMCISCVGTSGPFEDPTEHLNSVQDVAGPTGSTFLYEICQVGTDRQADRGVSWILGDEVDGWSMFVYMRNLKDQKHNSYGFLVEDDSEAEAEKGADPKKWLEEQV
ncbi:hypothetical protein EC957_002422 [Mortierella hygrophila]|uniref:Uncharacterized protein n=1 Tax=Mortierella hygrophila TaxID=979708 RepID=A0A9P6K7F9_9FUNG|nr:hypothetical protein EC957_002422 [Mortierella hygrophila]